MAAWSAKSAAIPKYAGGATPEQVPCAYHSWVVMSAESDIIAFRLAWRSGGNDTGLRSRSGVRFGTSQYCSVDGCGHSPCSTKLCPRLPTCPDLHPELEGSTLHRLGPQVTTSRLEVLAAAVSVGRGLRSRTSRLKATAATVTTDRPTVIEITVASPRFTIRYSTAQRPRWLVDRASGPGEWTPYSTARHTA